MNVVDEFMKKQEDEKEAYKNALMKSLKYCYSTGSDYVQFKCITNNPEYQIWRCNRKIRRTQISVRDIDKFANYIFQNFTYGGIDHHRNYEYQDKNLYENLIPEFYDEVQFESGPYDNKKGYWFRIIPEVYYSE
jgi:hypothetical protein